MPSPPPAGPVAALARELDVSVLTASILWQRGLNDPAQARAFLDPGSARLLDHRLLPGAEEAGARLAAAIKDRTLIAVAGDYDADGITAAALMSEFIRDSGGRTCVFLPNRETDGYGLNRNILQHAFNADAGLLVTVDSGITACEEAALARREGLPLVITDHHEPGQRLPDAEVIVDPKLSGPEAFRPLAGVGVALEVARAASAALGEISPGRLRKYLDLAALGTVTDVVPLVGENRTLVWSGLQVMNQGQRPGLRALAAVAGVDGGALGSQDLAFRLGPRLNAAGRLGDARRSLDLLLTRDDGEAERLAAELDRENSRRQSLERSVLHAALGRVGDPAAVPGALVLSDPEWPLGVLGLAASKLCERFHRPCFVLNERHGIARGSGRSIPGFPLHTALEALSPLLAKWGGHELAAGVTLTVDRVPEFARALASAAERILNPDQLVPELRIEISTPLAGLTTALSRELRRLEPFGYGNARPLFAVPGVTLAAPPRVVGERHLKLRVTDPGRRVLDVIGFGLGERAPELRPGQVLDLAGSISENAWNGSCTLQLEIKDLRLSAPEPAACPNGTDEPGPARTGTGGRKA